MTAESKTHGGKKLVLVACLTAGGESFVEGGGQHRYRDAFVDGRLNRPATLAGVRDSAFKLCQVWVGHQSICGQVQKPRGNHTTATPYFSNVRQVELVLILFR